MRKLLLVLLAIPLLCAWPGVVTMGGGGESGGGGGGGGGTEFTFVDSASGGVDAAGTTVSTSDPLVLAAGDLVVAMVSYEDGGATTATVTDGGSNSLTFDTGEDITNSGGEITVHPLYKTSASANATATFTATLGAAKAYSRIIVMQYRRAGTETVSKDISGTREGQGNSLSLLSGSFSTTGSDNVVCALSAIYTSGTHSNSVVAGTTADHVHQQNGAYTWCRSFTSPLTTQTASSTYTANNHWVVTVLGFKSE